MARSIPVFEILIESNIERPRHDYYGQLGYTLKDLENPDWKRAEENLESAIRVRDNSDPEPFYEFNRAICKVRINSNNDNSDTKLRELILEDLRYAKRGIGSRFEKFIEEADNLILLKWLEKNKLNLQDL